MKQTNNCPKVSNNPQHRSSFYPLVWIAVGILTLLSGFGCTHDHKVDLKPEIFVRVSNIGKGERLVVRVRDARSQKAISKKQSNFKVTPDRAIDTVNIYASSDVRDTAVGMCVL